MEQTPPGQYKSRIAHYGYYVALYSVGIATIATHAFMQHGASASKPPAACKKPSQIIEAKLSASGFQPFHLQAKRCDFLVITNIDAENHEPALGLHARHDHYPGWDEVLLEPGQKSTTVLRQSGTYRLHDHDDDRLSAELVIK